MGVEQLLTTSGPNSKVVWGSQIQTLEPDLAYQHPGKEEESQGALTQMGVDTRKAP